MFSKNLKDKIPAVTSLTLEVFNSISSNASFHSMGVKLKFTNEIRVVVNKYFPYLDLHIWLFGDKVTVFEM